MLCLHHRALSANASMVPALGPGSPRRHHTLSSTTPQLHLQPWGTPRCTSRHGAKRMEQAISHGPGHPAPHALVWVRAMEPVSMARPALGTHWKSPPQGAGRLIAVLPTRQHSVLPAQTADERSSHSSTSHPVCRGCCAAAEGLWCCQLLSCPLSCCCTNRLLLCLSCLMLLPYAAPPALRGRLLLAGEGEGEGLGLADTLAPGAGLRPG